MISFSILIPTHGRPRLLGRTLASLAGCRLPEGYRETVVVENGAKAGAEAVVAEAAKAHPHLRLRYLHVAWANKSHALNEALQTVEGGLVVFFDDDVRVAAGVLEAYAEAARLHPERAFFGGPLDCEYEQVPPEWLLALLPYSARGFSMEDAQLKGYFLGANWAAHAQDLRALGGFDPNFGPGSPTGARGQEKNMQLRMRSAGYMAVEVPKAIVRHYVSRDRCSPKWVVQRSFQTGAQQGQLASAEIGWRSLIRAFMRLPRKGLSVAKRMALRDEAGRCQALFALKYDLGFINGYVRHRLSGGLEFLASVKGSSNG